MVICQLSPTCESHITLTTSTLTSALVSKSHISAEIVSQNLQSRNFISGSGPPDCDDQSPDASREGAGQSSAVLGAALKFRHPPPAKKGTFCSILALKRRHLWHISGKCGMKKNFRGGSGVRWTLHSLLQSQSRIDLSDPCGGKNSNGTKNLQWREIRS